MRFGVSTPGGPTAAGEFERVAETVGQAPTLVLSYADFATPPPIEGLQAAARLGAEPVLTWEPWRWLGDGQYESTRFSMRSIADGAHDDYLYWWADALAKWGARVYLRFAHEANGTWYPWSVTAGTDPRDYVHAWRHAHKIFTAKGAHNVTWVWAPNISFPGSTPMDELYPGDDVVDVVGLDGYNWGTSQPWSHWIAPDDLFGPSLGEVNAIAPGKPVVITEVGSADAGGDKPQWIRALLDFVRAEPSVRAFIWFDHDKEADWRLASTPESAAAFADALGRKYR